LQAPVPDTPSPAQALARTDTFRWLERTGHHIWRMGHYLSQGRTARPPRAKAPEIPPSP
jgi:hypothetical protein